MYRAFFLFTLILLLFVYGCPPPFPTITESGTFEQKMDTITNEVKYDLSIKTKYCIIDTVLLTLFNQDSTVISDTVLYAEDNKKDSYSYFVRPPLYLKGTIQLFQQDTLSSYKLSYNSNYEFTFRTDENYNDSNYYFYKPKNNSGGIISIGLPAFNKATHREDVREVEEKNLFSFSFGFYRRYDRWHLDARTNFYSGRISKNDKKYLYEILDVGIKYLPKNKFDWTPIPVVRANLSKYKIVYGFNRFREYSLGVGVGLSIEKKFQRYTYTYNTSYGGYHKFDALFSYTSDFDTKFGTKYSFYHGKDLKMFSISYVFELYQKEQFNYPNKQNFIHKTLSAGPLAPFYWISKIVKMTQKP